MFSCTLLMYVWHCYVRLPAVTTRKKCFQILLCIYFCQYSNELLLTFCFFSSDFPWHFCFLTAIAAEKFLKALMVRCTIELVTWGFERWSGGCKWNPYGKCLLQVPITFVLVHRSVLFYIFNHPPQHMTDDTWHHRLHGSRATNFQMPLED